VVKTRKEEGAVTKISGFLLFHSRVKQREPKVVGLIHHFWWDELNHRLRRIFRESGYPYPISSVYQTLNNHKKVDIHIHPVDNH
jgi:hypothetical protein